MNFLISKSFFLLAQKMRISFNHPLFLTDATDRLGVLLTLLFFATFPLHAFSASATGAVFIGEQARPNSAIEANALDERRSSLLDYMRHQAESLTPSLPDEVRSPVKWALNGFHSAGSFLSFGVTTLDNDETQAANPDPVAQLMQPPAMPGEVADQWLASTGYHHRRGILPTHDTATLGGHVRQSLFSHYMQYDLHPYLAQNYFSSRNYYGAEMTLDFAAPADTSRVTRPWGQLVIGYTNGESSLMDHGRGIDMHGELHFSDNLTLNTGLRQSDTSGSGNYVLLQWKISTE